MEKVRLFSALVSKLTYGCFGDTELSLSTAVPPRQEDESHEEYLFRLVNSIRRIDNSNIEGFIVIIGDYFTKFRIEKGHAVITESGKIQFLKNKIFPLGTSFMYEEKGDFRKEARIARLQHAAT